MGIIKCCKDCPKKQVGCHSDCADYIIEKAFYGAEKAEQYEKTLVQRRLDDHMYKSITKHKKHIGKEK